MADDMQISHSTAQLREGGDAPAPQLSEAPAEQQAEPGDYPPPTFDIVRVDANGVTDIFEIGAGKVLTGLARRIAPDMTAKPVNTPQDVAELANQ